jgi:hypothetical protein
VSNIYYQAGLLTSSSCNLPFLAESGIKAAFFIEVYSSGDCSGFTPVFPIKAFPVEMLPNGANVAILF